GGVGGVRGRPVRTLGAFLRLPRRSLVARSRASLALSSCSRTASLCSSRERSTYSLSPRRVAGKTRRSSFVTLRAAGPRLHPFHRATGILLGATGILPRARRGPVIARPGPLNPGCWLLLGVGLGAAPPAAP